MEDEFKSIKNLDYIIDFYKELYFKEIERKEHLINSINVQIGISTGLVTIHFYLITTYSFSKSFCSFDWFFIIFVVLNSVALMISLYNLMLSYSNIFKGFNSTSFPKLHTVEERRIELISSDIPEEIISANFKESMIKEFVKHYDNDAKNNNFKFEKLSISKIISSIILILTFAQLLIYLINFNNKDEDIKVVKISNVKDLKSIINTSVKINLDSSIKNILKVEIAKNQKYERQKTKGE